MGPGPAPETEPTPAGAVSSWLDGHQLKINADLPTGSFKIRGALVALSARLQRGAMSTSRRVEHW